MFRILIGSVYHETNTYLPFFTGIEEFSKKSYLTGDTIVSQFKNTNTVLGAYIKTLGCNEDCVIVPSIAAIAEPSGPVKKDTFKEIKEEIFKKLNENEEVNGILLSLHGAMVIEDEDDGDGDLLESLRKIVGDDVPIVATLDLHANLTQKMVENADILVPYDEYPHVDMYERGLLTAELMLKILRREIKPEMQWRRLPLLPALTRSNAYPDLKGYMENLCSKEKVLVASILHGFYLADTKDTSASTIVITDGKRNLSRNYSDELAAKFWAYREQFLSLKTYRPEEAIAKANLYKEGTIVFADICDNPGIGSTCDGTHLLRAMLSAKVEKAAYAIITDYETVDICHKAGVGAYVDIQLGGKMYPKLLGEPIKCRAYIKTLFDGQYTNRGPMHGSLKVNLQKSAVIVVEGITIIVSSVATQIYDIEIFQSHGLMLKDFKILVVKSSIHYRAAFEPYSDKMYSIECPGALTVNPENVEYKKCKRPIYPLDKNISFA